MRLSRDWIRYDCHGTNVDALRANVAMLRRLGVDTDIISPEEPHRLNPDVSLENVALAAYEPHSGYADPIATTHSLADAARRAGTRFHLNTPVTSIRTRAARAIGVMDAAGRFHEADDGMPRDGALDRPPARPARHAHPHHPRARANRFF